MSQSPLARSTRRTLPAFSHTPSRLAHATSRSDLASLAADSPDSSPSSSSSNTLSKPALTAPITPKVESLRYRSTGTGTSPHTPKITYSPYALSTPPSALSKSTSIPFDMAANTQAGMRAQEKASKRSRESSTDSGVAGERKRFVRKKPFWQKVKDIPEDIYDRFAMYDMQLEDLYLPVATANPVSLVLHVLQWLLLAPLFTAKDESDSVLRSTPSRKGVGGRWERWEDEGKTSKIGLGGGWTTFIVTAILIMLACGNSIYLFTKYRTYDMQTRSANEPVQSPHASPIAAPRPQTDQDVFGGVQGDASDDEPREKKILRWTGWATVAFVKWSFWTILSIFGHRSSSRSYSGSTEKIQSLKVWEPPEWCLAFFCAYPPSAPILSFLLTPLHPFLTPILHLITSFLLSHLSTTYGQLVKDRMVLSAEVMREYDRRFVYKRIFGARVDRSVQTEQAESLW